MKKINMAQIGVGYWGPNLIRNLAANKDITASKVVDISEERRAFVNENYPSVRVGNEAKEILEDTGIEAAIESIDNEYGIDKENIPHVPFFKPLIEELKKRNIMS